MYLLVLYFITNAFLKIHANIFLIELIVPRISLFSSKQGKFIYSTVLNSLTIRLFRVYVFIVYSIQICQRRGAGGMPPPPDNTHYCPLPPRFLDRTVSAITKINKSISPLSTTVGKSIPALRLELLKTEKIELCCDS